MTNWQSPGQFQNMQAVPPNMPAVQGPYAYTVDQNGVQYPAPPVGVPTAGAPIRPPHRRQISEMGGADNPNMPKRQRMYSQPQPMLAVQAGRPG
jgi:osomolarity two-component system response regulator SKN7